MALRGSRFDCTRRGLPVPATARAGACRRLEVAPFAAVSLYHAGADLARRLRSPPPAGVASCVRSGAGFPTARSSSMSVRSRTTSPSRQRESAGESADGQHVAREGAAALAAVTPEAAALAATGASSHGAGSHGTGSHGAGSHWHWQPRRWQSRRWQSRHGLCRR